MTSGKEIGSKKTSFEIDLMKSLDKKTGMNIIGKPVSKKDFAL